MVTHRNWFFVAGFFVLMLGLQHESFAQSQQPQSTIQPLNASVSDFGTSFIFSPAPICAGCVETELGFLSLQGGKFLPTVFTVAPFSSSTDFTVLVNALDSEKLDGRRTAHLGNRWDFVVRQQLFANGTFVVTIAPRGTVFTRYTDGGRVGVTVAGQWSKRDNLVVTNFTLTKAIGNSLSNPKYDYQESIDYYRTFSRRGLVAFTGFQHEASKGSRQVVSTEQGIVIPFRNGQIELAVEQLNLNVQPVMQFQTRVIVNWGKIFHK